MRQTTLCYIEKNGSFLMLHRNKKKNDANRDKWIGIGGGFEEGESPEDCVLREVFEETGLTLNEFRYCGIITFVSDCCESEQMHLFHSVSFSGELRDCDEGSLEWVSKKLLFSLPMWEGDAIFLDLMEKNIPFFSLKLTYKGNRLIEAILNGKSLSE